MLLKNTLFNTYPLVVHANGTHHFKPHWKPIKDMFFSQPQQQIGPIEDTTIITFNNGHEAMGMLERCLEHLGVPYTVYGQNIENWVNSRHKPELTKQAAEESTTTYMMGLDSRDVLVLDDPGLLIQRFQTLCDAELLFAGDRFNWPNSKEFKAFEDAVPGARESEFRYLSGGCWIGKTKCVREFFTATLSQEPVEGAAESEQGLLKKVFPRFHPRVQIDYTCQLFQNIGFLATPIFELQPDRSAQNVPL